MTEPTDSVPADDPLGELLRRAALDEAPPAALRARAIALGAAPAIVRQVGALLRRIVAVALPGDAVSPFGPAFGVRGGAGRGRQWLYRAADVEIDLRASPRGDDRWTIAGQLFGELAAERVVLDGAGGPRSADIGPTREFVFADLPAGSYSLAVQSIEIEVVVPLIELGSPG